VKVFYRYRTSASVFIRNNLNLNVTLLVFINVFRWLDPGAFGTLGVGGGFALGAKLVCPESEVWVVYGDGTVGYSIAEFDTFKRHNVSGKINFRRIYVNF